MLAAIIGGVHLIAVVGFAIGLLIILTASSPQVSAQDLKAIQRVYLLSALALVIAAIAGGLLWLAVGKPAPFYTNNPVFHAKLGLFMLLLCVLAFTGVGIGRLQAKAAVPAGDSAITLSAGLRRLQKTMIPLLLIIPVLAWLMARGIGY